MMRSVLLGVAIVLFAGSALAGDRYRPSVFPQVFPPARDWVKRDGQWVRPYAPPETPPPVEQPRITCFELCPPPGSYLQGCTIVCK